MGDQTGCYVCGEQGHWSKDCRRGQNGSYGGNMGGFPGNRGPPRGGPSYGMSGPGGPPSRGYPAGPPPPPISRRPSYGEYGANTRDRYPSRPPSAYPERPPAYDREPYASIDYYEKYRAGPVASNFYEDKPLSIPPPPPPPSSSSFSRMRLAPPSLNPYDRHPMVPPPPTASAYFSRERSPIRRVGTGSEGHSYERSRLSPVSRSSASFEVPRTRDSYTERVRYTY